jgi:tRNA (cytidine/uridine-2'-O-)-methyltransferase
MPRDITKIRHRIIEEPYLNIVLFRPEIPANTGNIARLCGAAEIPLHLIHPLGFEVDDKHLRRAGLDYWHEIDVRHHLDFESFLENRDKKRNLFVFTRHTSRHYTEAQVKRGDYLLFGQETLGLPSHIRESYPCYSVPIWGKVRSLNLSTTVGIVAYHYLNQMGRF